MAEVKATLKRTPTTKILGWALGAFGIAFTTTWYRPLVVSLGARVSGEGIYIEIG